MRIRRLCGCAADRETAAHFERNRFGTPGALGQVHILTVEAIMRRMLLALACTLGAALVSGCHIKKMGGDEDDPDWEIDPATSCDDGGPGSGAGGHVDDGDGGNDTASCTGDADCNAGSYCDVELETCVPGVAACEDLSDESACAARLDCEPIYAGIDCSCGPDCACVGGEPGCVCEGFEFFACESNPPA
jgi:hypothetical protein